MSAQVYVRCKECRTPFEASDEIDLTDANEGAATMQMMMCPHCRSLRPYTTEDALIRR